MRKQVIIGLIIVAILSVSVYGYMTYVQPRAHGDSTILSLNTSADIQQVAITDYHKKVKKDSDGTTAPLSSAQISQAYTKILKDLYGNADIKVNVYGPFKYDNGKAVYGVEAVVEKDDFVEYIYMVVDGNTLPGNGADTIYAVYVCHMDKTTDVKAKLSKEDIIKLAKAEYAKHRTPADNDTYDVYSFVSDNRTIYDVEVNKGVMIASYDGDTGELLNLYVEEEQSTVHTKEECKQLAQQTLNSKDYNYSSYLSLGEAQEETENGSTNYTYNIIYTNGNDTQVLGSIKINANDLSVIDFSIHDPEVKENDTNDTADEGYVDTGSNVQPGYSQQYNSGNERPSYEPEPTSEPKYTSEDVYSY
ncbi:MAG: hypothetical protein BZ133_02195 [Methanosphaera sp. SHI613]|jgi:hypothetical protein|nr:MAG: hypothetical protein BZ133_02195 [Methanosphaera sp. SHI613]